MNISTVKNCYGCGVCVIACSKKIIKLVMGKQGFYEPVIKDEAKCTNCGLCMDVCSYYHPDLVLNLQPLKSFGAWSKEESIRRICSSGGVGFEIGRSLLNKGYKVIGVRYNIEKERAEHYIATTAQELLASCGSKYIQSYTSKAFSNINRKEKYLITGTPCQIDSFRRYIKKFRCENNFILMDFFCHGVPSMLIWHKYLGYIKSKIGTPSFVAWRSKQNGWHDSWTMSFDSENLKGDTIDWHDSYNLLIRGKKGYISSRWTQGDFFYNMFLGNNCLGKACYNKCKFKYNHSSADIRIGDMWGNTYKNESKGVTACVAFTDKGLEILHSIKCELREFPFNIVAEGQMQTSVKSRKVAWNILIYLSRIHWISMSTLSLVNRILNKIYRITERI